MLTKIAEMVLIDSVFVLKILSNKLFITQYNYKRKAINMIMKWVDFEAFNQ